MYSPSHLTFKYINHYITAANGKGHGIHSPFVFQFVTKVLNDKADYPAYSEVEGLREKLLRDSELLEVNDLGAGSVESKTNKRTIASIAKSAAKNKKFGQLLYRMVKFYQPRTIVELGTSLGITTSYLAKANPEAKIITLEGATEVLRKAEQNFKDLHLHNIETKEGDFDDTLPEVIDELRGIDFAFIDGNHRYQPTIKYFETVLSRSDNLSIIVLDDIHWSEEMEKAWRFCRIHHSVTMSIDLFFVGILIFRRELMEKQHFNIRF